MMNDPQAGWTGIQVSNHFGQCMNPFCLISLLLMNPQSLFSEIWCMAVTFFMGKRSQKNHPSGSRVPTGLHHNQKYFQRFRYLFGSEIKFWCSLAHSFKSDLLSCKAYWEDLYVITSKLRLSYHFSGPRDFLLLSYLE